jgi:hypothetical protein
MSDSQVPERTNVSAAAAVAASRRIAKTSTRSGRRGGWRHARMASPTPAAAAVLAATKDAFVRSGCSHDHAHPVRGRRGCVSATAQRTSDRTPAAVVISRRVRCR